MTEPEKPFGDLQKIFKGIVNIFKKIKTLNYSSLFRKSLAIISIISAYLTIVFTYQLPSFVNKIFDINIKNTSAFSKLLFYLSFSLICWQILAFLLKKKAMAPPPKKDEYQQIPTEPQPVIKELPLLQNGKKYNHQVIEDGVKKAVLFIVFILIITAQVYFNPQIKLKNIQINYILIWSFFTINTFIIGALLTQWTNCPEFKLFGTSLGLTMSLGLLAFNARYNAFELI